jgi:hypothetical protein
MKGHSMTKALILFLAACSWWLAQDTAEAGISIGGGLTHERIVRPGATYEGVVTIINTGNEQEGVEIYQTDYGFTCEGDYHYDDAGSNPRSNAQWVEFSPRLVTVPPWGTVDVSYTISVPDDARLSGTYWSILMIEVAGANAVAQPPQEQETLRLGIDQVVRYGVQLVTHVGDTGERKLDFVETRILRAGPSRILEVDLENIGERWLRPLVWAELYDEAGEFVGRFEAGKLRIFPGTSARYKVDLTDVPGGEYKALVVADCGADDVFGATYLVIFEHEDRFTVR